MGIFAKLGLLKNKNTPQDVQVELSGLKMDGHLHKRIKITDPIHQSSIVELTV